MLPLRKIVRRKDIEAETGLPIRSVYEEMDRGRFPQQVQLGKRSVGWFSDEIAQWREDKRRIRDGRLAAGLSPVDIPSANPKAKRSRGRPKTTGAVETTNAEN